MQDYEKLGVFYLGRHRDAAAGKTGPELLLLESKELVTHGLVVGMTGSGKTGLCFDLIEEAAIDGIPAIVIDPKGDLGNLLLTFPELRPEDFAPWINEDDARRRNVSVTDAAVEQAALWMRGLAHWDQDGERIRRLQAAAEFALYTPGSSAGLPLSILSSFNAPPPEEREDLELLRDRVNSTVVGLLGLVGIDADPLKSREAILLAHLILHGWGAGKNVDLPTLVQQVQSPPVQRFGVLDVESFFPAKERAALALQLNNLLASPGFAGWADGEPLEVQRLLFTPAGRPRVAILSVAHLSDAERMFFVTLVLNAVVTWMRSQSGTNSLRALVYMDEIAGYFPPVSNPPAKQPLLTLLKQGRAFGVGVVLATQNPVDLDYKGLANIGTWFIGRLQTERDKARVMEGLEGAATAGGSAFDKSAVEKVLAGLSQRVFLLHSVHHDGLTLFESRWAMSYLRGPLSRAQIKSLTAVRRPGLASAKEPAAGTVSAATQGVPTGLGSCGGRPAIPPLISQFFVRARKALPEGATVRYEPRLFGSAQVRYSDPRLKVDTTVDVIAATEIGDRAVPVDWSAAENLAIDTSALEKEPGTGDFAPVAPAASQGKNYPGWSRDFIQWIVGSRPLTLYRSSVLGEGSQPGESEGDFRARLQHAVREQRDAAAEQLRQKYAPKLVALQERVRRAEAARDRESAQSRRAQMDTWVSLGSTLLGAFLGRKALSATTVGRAAATARGVGRSLQQAGDVERADESVSAVQQQLQAIEEQFQAEVKAVTARLEASADSLEAVEVRATRTNVGVRLVALVWLPFGQSASGVAEPLF